MNINSISTAGVAGAVWTNLTRSLTSVGTSMTAISGSNVALAAGAITDLRPAAGALRSYTINPIYGMTVQTGFYNGTTFTQTASGGALAGWHATPAIGGVVKNAGATSANYDYAGWDIT